jgi:hypothetical protein
MDENLLEQPCFSLKCFVDDIQPAGDKHKWSATAVEYLKEVLPRGKLCQVAKNVSLVILISQLLLLILTFKYNLLKGVLLLYIKDCQGSLAFNVTECTTSFCP